MSEWLGYREAAKVARVSQRSVQRWRAEGMPGRLGEGGCFQVERKVLLAWKRRKLFLNPAGFRRFDRLGTSA